MAEPENLNRCEESNHCEEPVSSEKLGELYAKTVGWLERNIPPIEYESEAQMTTRAYEPSEEYEGWPVSNGLPRHEFLIPGSVVRQLLPEAAEQIELGDGLQLQHHLPHYLNLRPGEFEFSFDLLNILIAKQSDMTDSETLIIEPFLDDEADLYWESDRITDTKLPPEEVDESEIAEVIAGRIAGHALARRLGINRMTVREHAALSSIVENLDRIKAAMPDVQ